MRGGRQHAWQDRFEQAWENLSDSEREEAAEILRALMRTHAPAAGAEAPADGPTTGGNVDIPADHGSAAAVRMGRSSSASATGWPPAASSRCATSPS
ncbi:hypothetical protein [Streptomyces sp. BK79]|uniref:hypothetical protein n=1 Tax=Streptomyces sp. BK79 TaxID=3350097 RepID=UPI0037703B07